MLSGRVTGFRRWMPVVLLSALAAAALGLPLTNPDVFWHLSSARWMLEHRAVPRVDWLSWSMAGAPWADFEWLTQLVFQAFYAAAGMGGLWALKYLQLAGCALLLASTLRLYGLPPAARALGVFLWALGFSTVNDLRPEGFSFLLFMGLWRVLEGRRLRGPSLRPRTELLCGAAFFALWANLHAGFAYGLLLLGLHALGDLGRRRSTLLLACTAAGAAAALLNPYGLDVYRVLLGHAGELRTLSSYIREWQSSSIEADWLWPFWTLLAGSFLAVLARFLRSKDVPFEHLAALLLAALAAADHARMAPYLVSVAVPVAAEALSAFAAARWLRPALVAAALAGAAFFSVKILPPLSRLDAFQPRYVPARLGRFLAEERETLGPLRMVNPWHWGGYLGWRLAPDYKVFVDGRYIFHGMLAPMYAANRTPESYAAWLEAQDARLVLLERTAQLAPFPVEFRDGTKTVLWRPFYLLYLPKKEWALVYWDGQAMAFVRRDAVPGAWLQSREFALFRPDDLVAAAYMLAEGRARRTALEGEVERFARWADETDAAAARSWLAGLGGAR